MSFLGRKSHYVQTVNHKDIDFLNALRCGGMQDRSISMPDLAYGVDTFYEVVTSSYGEMEIQAKIEAVEAIGGNLEMERI